jgi:hypothetical protein
MDFFFWRAKFERIAIFMFFHSSFIGSILFYKFLIKLRLLTKFIFIGILIDLYIIRKFSLVGLNLLRVGSKSIQVVCLFWLLCLWWPLFVIYIFIKAYYDYISFCSIVWVERRILRFEIKLAKNPNLSSITFKSDKLMVVNMIHLEE